MKNEIVQMFEIIAGIYLSALFKVLAQNDGIAPKNMMTPLRGSFRSPELIRA
jgi:hypothetical protein